MSLEHWRDIAERMLREQPTTIDLLRHILQGQLAMAVNTANLTAAVAKLTTDVAALVAQGPNDTAAQAAVDAATSAVLSLDSQVVAATAPAGATGATGATGAA